MIKEPIILYFRKSSSNNKYSFLFDKFYIDLFKYFLKIQMHYTKKNHHKKRIIIKLAIIYANNKKITKIVIIIYL